MIYADRDRSGPRAGLWAAGATRRVIKDRWSKGVRCEELGVRSKPDPKPAYQTPMLNLRERGSELLGFTPYSLCLTPHSQRGWRTRQQDLVFPDHKGVNTAAYETRNRMKSRRDRPWV